jgi:hypothetical protein
MKYGLQYMSDAGFPAAQFHIPLMFLLFSFVVACHLNLSPHRKVFPFLNNEDWRGVWTPSPDASEALPLHYLFRPF